MYILDWLRPLVLSVNRSPAAASPIEDDIDIEDVLCGTCQLSFPPNSRAKNATGLLVTVAEHGSMTVVSDLEGGK